MANSKKVKKVYVCPTCKGNGYVKVACILDHENMIHQCWDCESQGEFYVDESEIIVYNFNKTVALTCWTNSLMSNLF